MALSKADILESYDIILTALKFVDFFKICEFYKSVSFFKVFRG